MRTLFYIHIDDLRPGAESVHCVSAPADSPHSISSAHLPLSLLRERLVGQRLIVFTPASAVYLTRVEVPSRLPAKVLQAAPYLLEDQLADEVDLQHFALGPRQGDGSTPVAVVALRQMQAWMDRLADAQLPAYALEPDVLALPPNSDPLCWPALLEGEQLLVRTGRWSGFSCQRDDLETLLELADPERQQRLSLQLPGDELIDVTQLGWPVEPMPGDRDRLSALARHRDPEWTINLRQGSFSVRSDSGRWLRPWIPALKAAALWVAIGGALYTAETLSLNRSLDHLHQANVSRFQALFPNEARVFDLEAQVNQQLSLLGTGGEQTDFSALLASVARAMGDNPGLQIESLQYREKALYVALTGEDLQVLESLRNWFAQQSNRLLEVQSANVGTDGVQIRLKISGT